MRMKTGAPPAAVTATAASAADCEVLGGGSGGRMRALEGVTKEDGREIGEGSYEATARDEGFERGGAGKHGVEVQGVWRERRRLKAGACA